MSANQSLPERYNVARHFLAKYIDEGRGQRTAFVYDGGNVSFEQLLSLAARAAAVLRNAGVEPEQRVALLLDDSPELVVAFWGAIWAGVVAVPINPACTNDDVRFMLEDSRARALVTTRARLDALGTFATQSLRAVFLVDELDSTASADNPSGGGGAVHVAGPLLRLVATVRHMYEPAPTHRDEAAFWLYTSGSTGRPKGVIHAHGDIVACAEGYGVGTLGLHPDDVCFSVAKIPFAYGLGATLYMPMWVGACAVLSNAVNTFDVAAIVREFRPTVLFAIPTVYSGIIATADIARFDASSLRLCISAAESLPESLFTAFHERFGLQICEGIGTTEFLHIFVSNRPGECRKGTCGKPVPGYEVRVLDENGKPALPAGEVGDLEVRGPSLMLGYWHRPSESLKRIYGGAMRTGDKYVVDTEGYFRFMGRSDDLYKVHGQWIAPSEVEAALREQPEVHECAVVLERESADDLPVIIASITLAAGVAPNETIEESVRRRARDRLPHFKVPRRVHIVRELPRTVTGKVDRKSLSRALSVTRPVDGRVWFEEAI